MKALLVMLAACGSFEDPNVVIDLRVLAMTASVPDQVVDVDPANPSAAISQVVPTTVCALVGDPASQRRLRWSLQMCEENDTDRCADETVVVNLASGLLDDPDTTVPAPSLCTTINPDGNLLGVLLDSYKNDTFKGLDGIGYQVALRIGDENDDPSLDIFASKEVKVSPRIPADRSGNQNPSIDELDQRVGDDGPTLPIALGRCADQAAPLVVAPDDVVRLTPVETAGIHEMYALPTISGGEEHFTESITYQWTASDGSFSDGSTGGKRDATGNLPVLFTDWTAPSADDLDGPELVDLWIVQRDERLGAHWYQTCVRVVP